MWGIASVLWRDSINTVDAVQYCGGYSVLWRVASVHVGIASVLWGIASVLWKLFSTVEG